MKDRESTIALRLEEAHRKQHDAKSAENRFLELSESLEHKRSGLFEQARAESEHLRNSLVEDARREIRLRREDWQQALVREERTLINLVRERASRQVVAISRVALSQLAGVELEEQTIESFLRQLAELPPDQVERLKRDAVNGEKIEVRTRF